MRARGSRPGDVPGQLEIPWDGAAKEAARKPTPPLPAPEPRQAAKPHLPSNTLVQKLRWDFVDSFPEPTREALEAGVIFDEDNTPEHVRAIHDEHARESLTVLHDLDAVSDARRRGVDPSTGKPPRTPVARERLPQRLDSEMRRLQQWYTTLLDTYEEAFGSEARDAFDKAIRARRAGIAVTAEAEARQIDQAESMVACVTRRRIRGNAHRTEARRVIARLPCPSPLPSAVAAGDFGQDENGRNIRPSPVEVREITEQHAEKLIDILDTISHAPRSTAEELSRLKERFTAGIAAYADSFGIPASRQLEAYVRRQLHMRDHPNGNPGRSR